ncbi:phosphatidylinositol 3-related kinase [Trypanosoma theileri]|uniref:non-specific serine/threonine protein kinase n=1 Tax=Trypanosoma theileri TaxID=67003 RepID=A0A1X0NUG6_9TRYP|nr:phosphatidylinositol 3-related kinase [Trypanosoma theileri]ORC88335.1 phosphatidylinositol 3-related kinase [Trypanosoma theileri]
MNQGDVNATRGQEKHKRDEVSMLPFGVKRPRDSMEEDSIPLRDALKAFGDRVNVIQTEIMASSNDISLDCQTKIWSLVLELRPYVLAALSSNSLEVPEEMKKLSQVNPRRVLKYVWSALRLYVIVASISVVVPGVLLHCVLTVLSLLPVIGAPSWSAPTDEKKFKKISHMFFLLCYRYPLLFKQLLDVLLQDETMGVFIFSATPNRQSSQGHCTIVIPNPPETIAVPCDGQNLFRTTIIAETSYEAVSVASGFCSIMSSLFFQNTSLQLTLRERGILIRLACGLLSVDLHESFVSRLGTGSPLTLERTSSGQAQDEVDSDLSLMLYDTAGSLLQSMLVNGLLVKVLHGPMLLYTLTQHLFHSVQMINNNNNNSNNNNNNNNNSPQFEWELKLLRWLTDKKDDNDASMITVRNKYSERFVHSETKEPHVQASKWLDILFLEIKMPVDIVFALIVHSIRKASRDSIELATLFLEILREAVSHKSGVDKIIEQTFCEFGVDIMEAFLNARVVPLELWFTDMSPRVVLLNQFLELIPHTLITPFITEYLACVDSDPESSTGKKLLAAANASLVFRESLTSNVNTLQKACLELLNTGNDVVLDAVVIFFRLNESSLVEQVTLDFLKDLLTSSKVLCPTNTPLSISILYAEMVRRLPLSNNAFILIKEVVVASCSFSSTKDITSLWRTIGVLRGFRERIAQHCKRDVSVPSISQLKQDTSKGKSNTIMMDALGEISSLLESLSSFLPCISSTSEGICMNALSLFWEQILDILTIAIGFAEQVRSTHSSQINKSSSSSNNKNKAAQQTEVFLVDEEESEEAERSLDVGVMGDDVLVITPAKKKEPPQRHCSMNEDGVTDGAELVLRGISTAVETVGWAARQLFLSITFNENDTLGETLLAVVSLCVGYSHVKWDTMEELVFSHASCHHSSVIRCGYAALCLRLMFTRRGDDDSTPLFSEKLLKCGEENDERLPLHLESLQAAFSGEYESVIQQGVGHNINSTGVDDIPLYHIFSPQQECSGTISSILLNLCITIWDKNTTTLSSKFAALEVAHAIMGHMSWSVEDLCWSSSDIIFTSFFKAICNREERSVKVVIGRSLNVLLPPVLLAEDWEIRLQRIQALIDGGRFEDSDLLGVLAYILYNDAKSPREVQEAKAQKLFPLFHIPPMDLLNFLHVSQGPLIAFIMYLEGGRQLHAIERTTSYSNKNNNISAFADLEIAVGMVLHIGRCKTLEDIWQTKKSSQGRSNEIPQTLTNHVFSFLDKVANFVGIQNDILHEGNSPSFCTVRRWLYSLTLLIRFLGNHATLIAPKLSAILEHCSTQPKLVEAVCEVWRDLVTNCAAEYLREHSPVIVVDLLSMEHMTESSGGATLPLLEAAIRVVYNSSSKEPFWKLCFKVMGHTSLLIRRLKSGELHTIVEAGSVMVSATGKESDDVSIVAAGFLSVMQSSSTKCKEIFIRALFQYLSTTDSTGRMEMTRAAVSNPQLVTALLNCACELRQEYVQYALACVGMIGAIADSHAVVISTERKALEQDHVTLTPKDDSFPYSKNEMFLPEDVLDWRILAQKLLSVHCLRALANTADPTMHDRAAFAVQELLRVCANAERSLRGYGRLDEKELLLEKELEEYTWWLNMEPTCKQMLYSYANTKYGANVFRKKEPRSPVYTTGMSFSDWLKDWFCDLLERCNGVFGDMVGSLRNMAKSDHALIYFLMPHIILNLLLEGNIDNVNAVVTEINVLFSAACMVSVRENEKTFSLHSQSLMMEVATPAISAVGIEEHLQQVFCILEHIEFLSSFLLRVTHRLVSLNRTKADEAEIRRIVEVCRQFFTRLEWTTKVKVAVAIRSNIRALRCIESQRYLPSVFDIIQNNVSLQSIFAALGDRDSSRSLHRTCEHQPEDTAFSHENNGEWSLALQSCELVLQRSPNSCSHQFTALRCMQQLGQLHLMSRYSQALLTHYSPSSNVTCTRCELCRPEELAALQNYANEAAWRLAEWDNVQSHKDLPVSLALPMLSFTNLLDMKGTLQDVFSACSSQRQRIAPVVRAACRESYAQVYPHVVFLHALTDIETAAKFITDVRVASRDQDGELDSYKCIITKNSKQLQEFGSILQERARFTDTTLEAQELLVSLQRSIFRAFNMKEVVTKTWMHYAKLLRNEGFLETALSVAKQAYLDDGFVDPSYYTTLAKLLHEMNMPEQAIEFAEDVTNNTDVPVTTRAKLRVLVTRWKQEFGYQTSQEVIAGYESALKMNASEMAHHYLALFYDSLYRSVQNSALDSVTITGKLSDEMENKKKVENIESYVLRALDHFGMAMQLGGKTVIVSLPRMLTLWLNCSAQLSSLASDSSMSSMLPTSVLRKINHMMERYLLDNNSKLPAAFLITALPQLLSRLGNGNNNVVGIITKTVVDLMITFPQQCLWQVLPIVFSRLANRSEVARQEIVAQFVKRVPAQKTLVSNMSALFKSLIELCNCSATTLLGGRSSPSASLDGQPFIQNIQEMLPKAGIILPIMVNLSPNAIGVSNSKEVFIGTATFHSFGSRVDIMSSLQKPKRIVVISNEGKQVSFLCKSRDEPRKDMRMMEIASLMNTFFLSDPEARRKRFSLRRYSVAALSDDCAIIEWVNNLSPFRKVVEGCYVMDGTGVRISQVKAWKAKVDSGTLSKWDMFEKYILPRTRPVLHNWFHSSFFSHQEWYQARAIYTQATALWSIAGHIVGLGDRHGENLMLDLRRGELMHVDFACMFDKGELLEVPERVRFRLTQNVVDGMGVLGVDGPFRACCQVALRCQMKNKTAVMSIVETLLHDPLVEWTRQSSNRQSNFDPKRLIDRVSRRLDGFLDLYTRNHEKDTLALGCEGQVSRLISHSSSLENLSEMYVWWMAWL